MTKVENGVPGFEVADECIISATAIMKSCRIGITRPCGTTVLYKPATAVNNTIAIAWHPSAKTGHFMLVRDTAGAPKEIPDGLCECSLRLFFTDFIVFTYYTPQTGQLARFSSQVAIDRLSRCNHGMNRSSPKPISPSRQPSILTPSSL